MNNTTNTTTIKKRLRVLIKNYPSTCRSSVLMPYKQEIYKLRFVKQASLSRIRSLLKQAGIIVSYNALAYFCKQHLSSPAIQDLETVSNATQTPSQKNSGTAG